MPKVSEFKEKAKKKNPKTTDHVGDKAESSVEAHAEPTKKTSRSQRRPGNIHHAQHMEEKTMEMETNTAQQENHTTTSESSETHQEQQTPATDEALHFFGSDALKEHAPALHRSLEIIVDDWKKDGRFEGLPLGHPLFQALASVGLQKAKKIEKKLDERGVFMMAKMGSDIVKMKLEELRGKKS